MGQHRSMGPTDLWGGCMGQQGSMGRRSMGRPTRFCPTDQGTPGHIPGPDGGVGADADGGTLWGTYGALWGSVGFYGALWGAMGSLWGSMGRCGALWGVYGALWGSMGFLWGTYGVSVGQGGVYGVSMGQRGV